MEGLNYLGVLYVGYERRVSLELGQSLDCGDESFVNDLFAASVHLLLRNGSIFFDY